MAERYWHRGGGEGRPKRQRRVPVLAPGSLAAFSKAGVRTDRAAPPAVRYSVHVAGGRRPGGAYAVIAGGMVPQAPLSTGAPIWEKLPASRVTVSPQVTAG